MKRNWLTAAQWRFLLVLLGLYFIVSDVRGLLNWRPALDPAAAGTLGITLGKPGPGHGQQIESLEPWSPLAIGGARAGDIAYFDHLSDSLGTIGPAIPNRALGIQDSIGITIVSGKQSTRLWVKPVRDQNFVPVNALISWICGWAFRLITLAVGILIAIRRSESSAMRWLALYLLAESANGTYFLPGGATSDLMQEGGYFICAVAQRFGLLYFVLAYPDQQPLMRYFASRIGLYGYAVLIGFSSLFLAPVVTTRLPDGWVVGPVVAEHVSLVLAWAYPCGVLAALWTSWRQCVGAARQRMAWIALSVGISMVIFLVFGAHNTFGFLGNVPFFYDVIDTLNFLSALSLGYAVLRHRVFDFGFVISRSIVFAIVSSLVLVFFALTEWAVDRVLHFEGRERSALVDAAIALVLILSFHRIQHWVSVRVNRILFREWQEAADRLRAFISRAQLITDPHVLIERFLGEIGGFSTLTRAALYVRGSDSTYGLQGGTLELAPPSVDENNNALLEMRLSRDAVDLSDFDRSLPGEYALPMLARGQLSGFVLIGGRAEAPGLRPDQMSLLVHCVQEIGLYLESLRTEKLERQLAEIRVRLQMADLRLASQAARP
jgi:hypothetical protein